MLNKLIIVFSILGIALFPNKLFSQNKKDTANKGTFYKPVESQAEFRGGQEALTRFIQSNTHYVEGAAGKKVFINFIIEKDGTLTNIKITKGINEAADKEALRILKLSPKWLPDIQNGHPRSVSYILPIKFPDR